MLRVWRENRDRIVGWYDRFVYWNAKERVWYYSWDVSCEPSLALTGAAIYHKVCTRMCTCTYAVMISRRLILCLASECLQIHAVCLQLLTCCVVRHIFTAKTKHKSN